MFYLPSYFPYGPIAQQGWRDPTDIIRWTPQGYVSTALDMIGEPIRTYSVYGVRGSSKYPFGKAFREPWEIDGIDDIASNKLLIIFAIIIAVIFLRFLSRN